MTTSSPNLRRLGAWLRGGLGALLILTGASLSSAEDAVTTSPLPDGAASYTGMPPIVPTDHRDKAAVQELVLELTRRGRARRGTQLGGDMLFGAAHAHHDFLEKTTPAFKLYAEAAAAYPAGDPTLAIVLFHHARREMWRGNHAAAETLLQSFAPWRTVRWPADLSEVEVLRWEALAALVQGELPRLDADLHEAHGQFKEAADALAQLLTDEAPTLQLARRISLYERIARLRFRAQDKEGALQAVEEALGESDDARTTAQLSFWQLYARHGLLTPDGTPGLTSTWPGMAFERDLRVHLRTLQDVPGLGTGYLALASSAFTAERKALALEIYQLAMRDPELLERARGNELIWRGLLMAFPAALELERFEEAERLLGGIERIAGQPIPEMDDYRIALREARAEKVAREKREADARRAREAGEGEGAGGRPDRLTPGGIETGERRSREAAWETEEGEDDDTLPLTPLLVVAGVLLLLGMLLLRRRGA